MRGTRQPRKSSADPAQRAPNRLRIIGGRWRGTRLQFPPLAAIRPTPDRVRETVFNWLQSAIPGAVCLDLFAGSGALGLEALSRGAAAVVFVDRQPAIGRYLRETLQRLDCTAGEVQVMDAQQYLRRPQHRFDVVFLDPPFAQDMLSPVCAQLQQGGFLSPNAYVYIERAADMGAPTLPQGWRLIRSKQAGQVGYHLARHFDSTQANASGPQA